MADTTLDENPLDPKFINYLFTLKKYDFHFLVGNKQLIEPEEIGVVTPMLMAHSEVLQSEMVLRDIEENKCVAVNDMYPDTFRNLLRYVYGYDNTAGLSFEEADNLLYAAEKYMIGTLKARLADRLIKLLNPDNICCLLNNPACYRQLELNTAITQILQTETERVLGSPQFIDLSSNALIKVFEQDAMNVVEIEVWRAATKWAKHQVQHSTTSSDNGLDLLKALEGPAKYIRVCTIDDVSFVDEVCPTGILTDQEVNMIFISKVKKEKQDKLIKFSNEVECRRESLSPCELNLFGHSKQGSGYGSSIFIATKNYAIELLPFQFNAMKWPYNLIYPEFIKLEYQCKIDIFQVTEDFTKHPTKFRYGQPNFLIKAFKLVEYGNQFTVPVTEDGKNITLLPKNIYILKITFNTNVSMFFHDVGTKPYEGKKNQHISVDVLGKDKLAPFQTLYYLPHRVKLDKHQQ